MKKVAFKSIRAWLTMLSPFFKHDAFEAEAEWRKFVSKDSRPMPGQQFRQGNSAPIPFVEPIPDATIKSAECVPQAVGFIDEVVVGPTPAPELDFLKAMHRGPEVKEIEKQISAMMPQATRRSCAGCTVSVYVLR